MEPLPAGAHRGWIKRQFLSDLLHCPVAADQLLANMMDEGFLDDRKRDGSAVFLSVAGGIALNAPPDEPLDVEEIDGAAPVDELDTGADNLSDEFEEMEFE